VKQIRFCGDVWIPTDYKALFPEDLCEGLVFNLEGPITSVRQDAENKVCLASNKESFQAAFPKLPLVACLANNHILDHGIYGFNDTLENLREMGIAYYGAGTVQDRCNNPLLTNVGGRTVGLMGYVCPSTHPIFASADVPGVAPIDLELIHEDIELARLQGAERLIVSVHWGADEVSVPKPSDVLLMKEIFRLGVDLVIGHHSHCLQPVIQDNERFGFFSLGNALFPDFEYRSPSGVVSWKRNRRWNRIGTFVSYRPECGTVSASICRERNGSVQSTRYRLEKMGLWKDYPTHTVIQEAKYRLAAKYSYVRLTFSRLLARPHLPSMETLKFIVREMISR